LSLPGRPGGDGPGGAVHTVRKGDTLWGIARRYGVPLTDLIAANPQIKNPNLIYPGQTFKIPE
jgi:spore coat assembly protein SafA